MTAEKPKSNIAHIVIVGAGQAGASAVETLRAQGYQGHLTLIGDEPQLPYQRPPLSKKYLLGEIAIENLLLHPESFYTTHNVDLRIGLRAEEINPHNQTLHLSDKSRISWDRLLLATGARAQSLPAELTNAFDAIHMVRSIRDVDRIASRFTAGKRVLVIGGGYIGLEVAAIARQRGLPTTLLEAAPRILQRVAAEHTSGFFAALHRRNGVDLREGVSLNCLSRRVDGSCMAYLSNGDRHVFDMMIVGIGVFPEAELAAAASLTINNGIAVDQFCRTSQPKIFAAGDCASFPWRGRRIRLESVQNAIEQGKAAAINMLTPEIPYDPVPWFWSDQYDVKLQIAGLNHGFNHTIARPGTRSGASSLWYYRTDQLLAVDAFNDAAAFMTAKRLLAAGLSPPPDAIADPGTDLKSLIPRAASMTKQD